MKDGVSVFEDSYYLDVSFIYVDKVKEVVVIPLVEDPVEPGPLIEDLKESVEDLLAGGMVEQPVVKPSVSEL